MVLFLDIAAREHHDAVRDGYQCERDKRLEAVFRRQVGSGHGEQARSPGQRLPYGELWHIVIARHTTHDALGLAEPLDSGQPLSVGHTDDPCHSN